MENPKYSNTKMSSIPSTLRDLLSKLEFLSMIKPGQKPCMGDMTFVDGNSFWGAIIRAFKGEGNKGMIAHIHQIIEQTVEAIEEYQHTEFLPIILSTLYKAKIGITNLNTTYKDQPSVISKINVILANINHQLHKNKSSIPISSKPKRDQPYTTCI